MQAQKLRRQSKRHQESRAVLQEYIEAILALEAKHKKGTVLPLAIMTSGDTHERTEAFLKENNYFGAKESQITLMKQEKVMIPNRHNIAAVREVHLGKNGAGEPSKFIRTKA